MPEIANLPVLHNSGPKYISDIEIIAFFEKYPNATRALAGKEFGVTHQAITYRLAHMNYTPKKLQRYTQQRAKISQYKQSKIEEKQIDFLAGPTAKIADWREYKDAEISKSCAQQKELELVEQKSAVSDVLEAILSNHRPQNVQINIDNRSSIPPTVKKMATDITGDKDSNKD